MVPIRKCNGAAIVDAIVALAKTLNLRVIAEGIETTSQLDKLATMGVDAGQGFLFSEAKPLTRQRTVS